MEISSRDDFILGFFYEARQESCWESHFQSPDRANAPLCKCRRDRVRVVVNPEVIPFTRSRTISQSDWVQELKRVSNLWLKQQSPCFAKYEGRAGYAAFSVSQSHLNRVQSYIAEQEGHHRKMGFQEELRALLRKHQLEWDERYLWN